MKRLNIYAMAFVTSTCLLFCIWTAHTCGQEVHGYVLSSERLVDGSFSTLVVADNGNLVEIEGVGLKTNDRVSILTGVDRRAIAFYALKNH